MKNRNPIVSLLIAVVGILSLFGPAESRGEEWKALLIGNGDYDHLSTLSDPLNDVDLIKGLFLKWGMTCYKYGDLDDEGLKSAFTAFHKQIRKGDQVVIYYSGHGIQLSGVNYLLPIDIRPKTIHDLKKQTLSLTWLIDQISEAGAARCVVFLDSCRDNGNIITDATKEMQTRSLSIVSENVNRSRPAGTQTMEVITFFSTKHGSVAYEGVGLHSPFTSALATELDKEKRPLRTTMDKVIERVRLETHERQQPYTYGSLTRPIMWPPDHQPRPAQGYGAGFNDIYLGVSYRGREGLNIRDSRMTNTNSNLHGALFHQTAAPLRQLGMPVDQDGTRWVQVQVKGWVHINNKNSQFLEKVGDRQWKVVWNRRNDLLNMRVTTKSSSPLIAKLSYATVLTELERDTSHPDYHYILGEFSGWAVEKGEHGTTYMKRVFPDQ